MACLATPNIIERQYTLIAGCSVRNVLDHGLGGRVAAVQVHLEQPGCQGNAELIESDGPITIKIYTLNGAEFLGLADQIGSLAKGQQADIMIVKGDPSTRINDIENVEVVFKDGVGWDSKKLVESVKGQVGTR